MDPEKLGLAPVAGLSLIVGGLAVIAVGCNALPLIGSTSEPAEMTQLATADLQTSAVSRPARLAQSDRAQSDRAKTVTRSSPRPKRSRIVVGGDVAPQTASAQAPVISNTAEASVQFERLSFVPRLKPRQRPEGMPIVHTIDPGATYLASSAPLAFASMDDFTGGQDSLFAAYAQAQADVRAERSYMTVVLNRGENLSQTLSALGADDIEIDAMLKAAAEVTDLSDLEAGTAIDYAFEPIAREGTGLGDEAPPTEGLAAAEPTYDLALVRLRFRPDDRNRVTAWRKPDGTYTARSEALDIERRYAAVGGVINHSLFMAGHRAEVPPEIMQRFANLFLYDIDFARDIFAGDRFEVVYEVLYDEEGQYVGSGDIVFAAMSWRGSRQQKGYYQFTEAEGMDIPYFDASGESATRLLMKTPIEGARVTSGFGRCRHPILGYTKGHKGVDFGAPSGTPIMAAGDGEILRAAPTGTYGNYIKIKHSGGFETAYAHLKGFAKGIKSGSKVKQGDIIGYVGTTGRSTGPHLHYEVIRNEEFQNPMTLEMANGRILEGDLLEDFDGHRIFVDTMRVHPYTVASATNQ